ncbi:MAG: hypothetical protein ABSG53_26720 [Thermoguttaceae bacterium]|jgi:hypothetical protein
MPRYICPNCGEEYDNPGPSRDQFLPCGCYNERNARIMVVDETTQRWRDLGEGPWETYGEAVEFARSEVGVPWVVIDDLGDARAYGDAKGECFHFTR